MDERFFRGFYDGGVGESGSWTEEGNVGGGEFRRRVLWRRGEGEGKSGESAEQGDSGKAM